MLAATALRFRHPATGKAVTLTTEPEQSFLNVLSIFGEVQLSPPK